MQKLLTGFAAAAAVMLLASAGQACEWHAAQVTASIDKVEQGVAMSTYDGAGAPAITVDAAKTATAAECPQGATDCVPASK